MNQVNTGRWIVLGIIAVVLLLEITATTLFVSLRGTERLDRQIVRFLIALSLCIWLYRGSRIARYLLSVCLLLGAFLGHRFIDWNNSVSVAVGLSGMSVFLVLAGLLMWSGSVQAFLAHQRAQATAPPPTEPVE